MTIDKNIIIVLVAALIVGVGAAVFLTSSNQNDQGYDTDDDSGGDSGGDSGTADEKDSVASVTLSSQAGVFYAKDTGELGSFLLNAKGNVTITLFKDLEISESTAFYAAFVFNSKDTRTVTFNLNGHSIEGADGEAKTLINMTGGNLILNGGDKTARHSYEVTENKETKTVTTSGGTLRGMTINLEGNTFTANDVSFVLGDEMSKGSAIDADMCKVILNSCYLGYNSSVGGGTICLGTDSVMYLKNTTIDNNVSSDGGAIFVNGDNIRIEGTDSSITNNRVMNMGLPQFKYNGGAIYVDGDNCSISGITFSGNTASSCGSAIFVDEDDCRIENCSFTGNGGDSEDGTIYVNGEGCSITGCTFKNNVSRDGLLYVYDTGCSVKDCSFERNTVGCGVIYVDYTGCSVKDCSFRENSTGNGIIYLTDDSYSGSKKTELDNCSFVGNNPFGSPSVRGDGCKKWTGTIYVEGTACTADDF